VLRRQHLIFQEITDNETMDTLKSDTTTDWRLMKPRTEQGRSLTNR